MDAMLAPVRIVASITSLKTSKFHRFRMIIILVTVTVSIIFREILKPSSDAHGIIVASVDYAQYNFRILITFITLIITNKKEETIDDFIKSIKIIDKKFKTMRVKINYGDIKKTGQTLVTLIIIKIALQQIPFFFQGLKWKLTVYLDYIGLNIPFILIYVLLAQWIAYLKIFELHITTLNKIMKTLRYRKFWFPDDFQFKKIKRIPKYEIIRDCSMIYNDLCLTGAKLNGAFAQQLLFLIPTVFVLIIYNSFRTFHSIKNREQFDFGWMIFAVLSFEILLEMVLPCTRIKEKSQNTVDILLKIDDEIVNEMILQTYHQKMEFTTSGVFSLNGKLIYSVIGALTTYLVMLLQFDF